MLSRLCFLEPLTFDFIPFGTRGDSSSYLCSGDCLSRNREKLQVQTRIPSQILSGLVLLDFFRDHLLLGGKTLTCLAMLLCKIADHF